MDESTLWGIVDGRRRALAELVDGLQPSDWDVPSLCAGWTVRHVVAHLTMPLLGVRGMLAQAVRHPGGLNHVIHASAVSIARRASDDDLRSRVRALVGLHRPMPGLTAFESLVDATVHGLDVSVPLGRELPLPHKVAATVADGVLGYGTGRNAKVFARLPLDGVRLVATDHAWTAGEGLEARGTMRDLLLLVTGRRVGLAALDGPGAVTIRERLARAA